MRSVLQNTKAEDIRPPEVELRVHLSLPIGSTVCLGVLSALFLAAFGPAVAMADRLDVQNIADQVAGTAFAVDVHVVDAGNNPVNVSTDTTIELTLQTGTGVLGGTLTGVILTGTDRVTISGVRYDKAEAGVVLRATATVGDLLTPDLSNAFAVSPGPAYQLIFSTQPVTRVAGTNLLPAVTIRDAYSNTVTADNRTITLTLLNANGATLAGTVSLLTVSGVATWTATEALNIQKVGTGYQLRAAHSGATFPGGSDTVNSSTFNINPDAAHHLAFTTQPSNSAAGAALVPAVTIQDQYNNTVTADNRTITLSFATNPGGGSLNGTASLLTTNGVATWTGTQNLNITVAANGYQLQAAHSGAVFAGSDTVVSNAFNITPAASHDLVFTAQPVTGVAGTYLLPAVTIRDAYGNTVTTDNRTITLALLNANGATLAGTTSLLTTNGVATWTATQALNIQKVGTNYQLRATHNGAVFPSGTNTIDSSTFNMTPGVAHHLAFSTQPGNTAAGGALVPVVAIQDLYNNTVTSDNRTITLSFAANPGGTTLNGTTSLLTTNGLATWTGTQNLNITVVANGYQLHAVHDGANFSGTDTVDSSTFNITPAAAHHLVFSTQPVTSTAGAVLTPQVTIRDQYNNTVTGDNRTITLSLLNANGASLSGTTSLITTNGVATWTGTQNLNIQKVGTSYQLRAAHSGAVFAGGSDTADSSTFDITPGAAHHLAFTTQPANTAAGGALLPQVTIQDQYNNTVTGDNRTVALSLLNANGASLAGTTSLLSVSGVATWTGTENLHINKMGAGYQLRAGHDGAVFGGTNTVDSNAFNITPAAAHHLAFTVQPVTTGAGLALFPQVTIRDQYDNTVTGDNRTITLSFAANPGGATLNGTPSLLTASGVATWTGTQNLNITVMAAGYSLRAAHDGAAFAGSDTVDSASFDITVGLAHHLAFSTQPANTTAGVALLPAVAIQDQYNNVVTTDNRTINLTLLNANGATLTGTTSLLSTSGVAIWTGTQNLRITKTGVGYQLRAAHSGAAFTGTDTVDSTTFNITPDVADHMIFSTQPTNSAAGAALVPQITICDQYGNTVTGDNRTITLSFAANPGGATLFGTASLLTVGGVATWTGSENLNITVVSNNYQLHAVHSGASFSSSDSADSSTFNITAAAAHNLAVTVQPVTSAAGAALLPAVCIQDAYGNTVTGDDRTIMLGFATNPGGATLGGTTSVLTTSGVATWTPTQNLNITVPASGYSLRANHSGGAFSGGTDTVDTGVFNITPAAANHLVFSTQPVTTTAGVALVPQIAIRDAYDNTVTSDDRTITLSLLNANGASLAGTASLVTTNGVATWTGTQALNIHKVGTGYQLRAAHSGATFPGGTDTVDSTAFNITPDVAHHLAFTVEPVDTTAGQSLLPGVTIRDQFDNTVTGDDRTIALTLLNAGGAVLGGTTSKLTVGGVTNWNSGDNLNIQIAGTGYQLRAGHSGSVFTGSDSADSAAFAIVAETMADHLAFTVQPVTSAAGAALLPQVTIQDQFNNTVSTATRDITLSFAANPGGATLGGTLVLTTVGGVATWSGTQNLSVSKVAVGYELRATGSGAFSGSSTVDSGAFDIVPASADHLLFTSQPANATAGGTLTPQVTIRDVYENPVTGDNRTITLTLLNAGGGMLSGTTSLLTVGGVATWTGTQGLNIRKAGSGYQLRATHTGAAFASSDAVDSNAFNITPEGSAHHLAFTVQPTNSAAGAALLPQVTIRDQFDNTVTADDREITLSFAANPGGAVLNGTAALTTTSGVATWLAGLNLSIATAASGYQLRATGSGTFGGSATIDSDAFDITPTGLHHFDVAAGTNPVTVGQAVTLTVTARDIHGNAIPSYATTNAITLSTNTAGAGDNLSYSNGPGTLVDHHDGTATIGIGPVFDASGQLHVDVGNQRAETITVTVSDGVVTSGTVSVSWTAAGVLDNFLLQAAPISVVANAATTLTLTARDLYNNPIPNFTTSAPIAITTNTGGDGSNLDYGCANPSFVDNGAVATFSAGTTFNGSGQLTLTLIDRRAETITITASDGVAGNGSTDVTWTPAAALLLEIQPVASQIAGQAFGVTIHLTDQFHNLSDVVANTDIALAVAAGDGTLGGTTTGTVAAGTHSVTLAGVSYDRAESDVVLVVRRTSGDFLVSGTSNAFNVTGAAATKLAFDPDVFGNQVAGQAFSVTVAVLDSLNNPALVSVDTDVVLSVFSGTGTLIGTTTGTLTAGAGAVTLAGVKYNKAESNVVLRASRTNGQNLTPGDCIPFSVAPGIPSQLIIEPIATQAANAAFAVVVDVLDDYNNMTGVVGATTVQLDLDVGTGTLGGTRTRTLNPGGTSAMFSVTYDTAEANVRLLARVVSGDTLTTAVSNTFTVNASPPVRLRFDSVAAQTAGLPFSVTIRAVDTADNTAAVTADTLVVLSRNTGQGNIGGEVSGLLAAGTSRVTIAGVTYDTADTGVSLAAQCTSGDALAPANTNLFSVSAGAGVGLRFVVQPTNTDIVAPLVVSIEVIDALGNRTPAADVITLGLVDPTGCGGALAGTPMVAAVNGLATFASAEDVVIRQICADYRLRASVPGLAAVDSEPFQVSAGTNLAVATVGLNAPPGSAELVLTYTITGARTVEPFFITYGLNRAGVSVRPLEQTIGSAYVDAAADRTPGTHTRSLGNIRASLDDAGIRNGDRLVVVLDPDGTLVESDIGDNMGTVALTVDLILDAVVPDVRAGVSSVRIVYSINSPARVPDFVIRAGFDVNGDGVIEDALPDFTARDSDTIPGTHVLTFGLPAAMLSRQARAVNAAPLLVVLDAMEQVIEADETGNNQASAAAQGYPVLAVALASCPDYAVVDDELECTWRIRNDGIAAATGMVLQIPIRAGTQFVRATRLGTSAATQSGSSETPLNVHLPDGAALVAVDRLDPGASTDVAVTLRVLAAGTVTLEARVSAEGEYAAWSDATEIEAAEAGTPPVDMLVQDTTTTVQYTGLCGWVGPFTLSVCLVSLLGLRVRYRAARRGTRR